MNCEQIKQHWHLFHDSEGDAELHHQINEHLAMCPDCSRWYYGQSRLEDAMAERLRAGQPTKAIWDRIRARCNEPQPAALRSWFFSSGMFTLAALVLFGFFGLVWYDVGGNGSGTAVSPDLASLSVALHEKLASGREAVKFTSRSPEEVEDYVRTQVSFPVRCPPRDDAGFQVDGGGVCKFKTDPVAYVVGRVDGERVSVFIMARESLSSFPAQREAFRRHGTHTHREGKYGIAIGEIDRNLVLVVGRLDSDRLLRVLKAYGTYSDHRSTSSASPASEAKSVS